MRTTDRNVFSKIIVFLYTNRLLEGNFVVLKTRESHHF